MSAVDSEGRAIAVNGTATAMNVSHASTSSEASSNNASDPLFGGPLVAVKVYERAKLSPSKLRAVRRETAMMIYASRKGVPSTVRFLAAFDDEGKVHIVMEACGGGDLLERLLHEGRAFSETRAAAEVATPLLSCLASLHALSIVHRDVKLENVFVGDDGRVRLGDFGLTLSLKQELAISPVGTVEYMAPEIVALPPVDAVTSGAILPASIAACDEKVDVWALGVTLYELLTGAFFFRGVGIAEEKTLPKREKITHFLSFSLSSKTLHQNKTGHLPFEGADKAAVKASIAAHSLRPFPRSLSSDAVDFVSAMLSPRPADRPSAAALLRHPFVLKNTGPSAPCYAPALFPPVCRSHDGCAQCLARAAGQSRERALASLAAAFSAQAQQQQARASSSRLRRTREATTTKPISEEEEERRNGDSGNDSASMLSASSVREMTSVGGSSSVSTSRDERSSMITRSTSSGNGNNAPGTAAEAQNAINNNNNNNNGRGAFAQRSRSSLSADSDGSTGSGILDVLDEVDAPPPPSVVVPPWRGNTHRRAATDAARGRGGGADALVGTLSPAPSAPLLHGAAAASLAATWTAEASLAEAGPPGSVAPPFARFVTEKKAWPTQAPAAANDKGAAEAAAAVAAAASRAANMARSASMPANVGKAAAAGALPSSTLLGGGSSSGNGRRARGGGSAGGSRSKGAAAADNGNGNGNGGGEVDGQWSRKLRTRLRSLLSLRSVTPTNGERREG